MLVDAATMGLLICIVDQQPGVAKPAAQGSVSLAELTLALHHSLLLPGAVLESQRVLGMFPDTLQGKWASAPVPVGVRSRAANLQ